MTEAEQQRGPVAAGAEKAQAQLASIWLQPSTSQPFVQQLALHHKLTQQQVQVLLNVQRQCDAAVLWRVITLPASAGPLSGHMIVELKQQLAQPEQEPGATHSITRSVYAPCGTSLPAKDAQALVAQHVMSTHNRLRRLEQQRRQLLAGSSSSVVVKEEPEQQLQQLTLDLQVNAAAAAAVAAGATDEAECGISAAAAAAEPNIPAKPVAPQNSADSSVDCCRAEKAEPLPAPTQEQGLAVEQQSRQQLCVPKQEQQQLCVPNQEDQQQQSNPEVQEEQQPSPMLVDGKPEGNMQVSYTLVNCHTVIFGCYQLEPNPLWLAHRTIILCICNTLSLILLCTVGHQLLHCSSPSWICSCCF
jgi:hypothetical protein